MYGLSDQVAARVFPVAPAAEVGGHEFQRGKGVDDAPDADGVAERSGG